MIQRGFKLLPKNSTCDVHIDTQITRASYLIFYYYANEFVGIYLDENILTLHQRDNLLASGFSLKLSSATIFHILFHSTLLNLR